MDAGQALRFLGLRIGATRAEVKEAYRDLVLVWHPDRFPEGSRVRRKAEERLRRINEAYEILRNYDPRSSEQQPKEQETRDKETESRARQQETRHEAGSPSPPPQGDATESAPAFIAAVGIIAAVVVGVALGLMLMDSKTRQNERPVPASIDPNGGTPSPASPRSLGSEREYSFPKETAGPATRHLVKRGETLSGIAARYGISTLDLRRFNELSLDRPLRQGMLLTIPARHVVQRGESIRRIAALYWVSPVELARLNGLGRGRPLRIGMLLTIPVGGDESSARDDTGRGSQAQSGGVPPGDVDALVAMSSLTTRWNLSAAPLVRDYLDPNVLPEQWIREAAVHVGELRAIHMQMHAITMSIQHPGIRNTMRTISANYRAKLDCVTALNNAVASGDEVAERQAQQTLSEVAAEGQALAQSLIDSLRPHVDPQVLSEELMKRGVAIGELMKPRQ